MPGPPNYSDDGKVTDPDTDTTDTSQEDVKDSFMQRYDLLYYGSKRTPRNVRPTPPSNRDLESGDSYTPVPFSSSNNTTPDSDGLSTALLSSQSDASSVLLGVHDTDHPAHEVIVLVEMMFALYMIMLGYLSWGPTKYSPREQHTALFWSSVAVLVYAGLAVFVFLKMHKIGGAWTRWANILSYTIYVAAIVGFAVLIWLLSSH